MNAGMAYTYESQFGPPSEPINISDFIRSASGLSSQTSSSVRVFAPSADDIVGREVWDNLPEEQRNAVASECSVSDITTSLLDVWNNPILLSHITKNHEAQVASIYESADTSNRKKRKRSATSDAVQTHPDAIALQKKLDAVQLKSWPLLMDAALFMRAPKNTDQNALSELKLSASNATTLHTHEGPDALITVTVHNRLSWGPGYMSRCSQHAVLASQTLGDLFDVIPCPFRGIPDEIVEGGETTGYDLNGEVKANNGCVICIEGIAYGNGQSDNDYADKLIAHLKQAPEGKRPTLAKGITSIHDTPWFSLVLRLNEPYWLLHQGDCEHFLIIDQIRLRHPSDPPSGYPLTLQITPPLLDLCRACSKTPAVLSVVGDIRLGESPCMLCQPCWRSIGDSNEQGVIVVPLPQHEFGW